MLTASLLRRRIFLAQCGRRRATCAGFRADGSSARQPQNGKGDSRRNGPESKGARNGPGVLAHDDIIPDSQQPSLMAQLFPEEEAKRAAKRPQARDIPRLPLEESTPRTASLSWKRHEVTIRRPHSSTQRIIDDRGRVTSVLVLRNASKNLLEEDFRRLVPQGKHLESWTLEKGDILKVIPGRDLATLAPQSYYYLLFASAFSAFAYQAHVTRIYNLVASHAPSSILSPIPPPPGYKVGGVDAHEAIQSFSLVPPSQRLDLRQLKPPLSPMMESIVRNGGYASLVNRKGRMPFEARLTLDGPQLPQSTVRQILFASGRARGLSWSGGDDAAPHITKWVPLARSQAPSPMSKKLDAIKWARAKERTEEEQAEKDAARLENGVDDADGAVEYGVDGMQEQQQLRRTPPVVYILGFHTENAMQSFVRHWNRKPLEPKGVGTVGLEEGDLAPVAHVEVLW